MIKLCKLERYTTSSKASESTMFLKDFLKTIRYIPVEQTYSNGQVRHLTLSDTCITLYIIHGKLLYKIDLSSKKQALSLSLPMDKAASGSYCVGMSDRNLAVV